MPRSLTLRVLGFCLYRHLSKYWLLPGLGRRFELGRGSGIAGLSGRCFFCWLLECVEGAGGAGSRHTLSTNFRKTQVNV